MRVTREPGNLICWVGGLHRHANQPEFVEQFRSHRSAFLVATVSLDCGMILIGKLLLAVLAGAVIITAL